MARETKLSPLSAALRQRCVICGEGKIYQKYLTLEDACPHCAEDFTKSDTADGPAFFVSFAALILFGPFFFIFGLAPAPTYVKVLLEVAALAASIAFILAALPRVKALMLALQIRHHAHEAGASDLRD